MFLFLAHGFPCSGSWWVVVERSRGACRRLAGGRRPRRSTDSGAGSGVGARLNFDPLTIPVLVWHSHEFGRRAS